MQNNQDQASRVPDAAIASEAESRAAGKTDRRHAERRRSARYPVSAALEAVELQSKARFAGRISDLSLGGCYVDTMTTFPPGAALKIRVTGDGRLFETKAKTVTSTAGMGMSLMFTEIEPQQLATLQAWIRELSGELLPSEPELPELQAQQDGAPGSNVAQVVNELITELARTGVLSAPKGRALLQKLPRR